MTTASKRSHPDYEAELALQMRADGVPDPQTQQRLIPKRRFAFDFSWQEYHVAVEVQGGTWSGGRHTRGAGYESDCVKHAEATLRGWMVLAVTGQMVRDGRALDLVKRALAARAEGQAA